MPTTEAERPYLLAFRALAGLGDRGQEALLRRFGSAKDAWTAPLTQWKGCIRVSVTEADRERAWTQATLADAALKRRGAVMFDVLAADYPAALRSLHDAPTACFFLGRLELLGSPIVCVVGSRGCTLEGLEAARWLAAQLSAAGLVVASGLARGIDAAAHEGALAAGGPTVAVLGCGFDAAYPAEHAELQMEIERRGLLVSEFLPEAGPRKHHFPRRNRLLAALALGVVVVEARVGSGALITVDHALDLGKPVMAVPGPISSLTHEGSNDLLREGATLVLEAEDILRCLLDHGWDGRRFGGEDPAPSPSSPTTSASSSAASVIGRRPIQREPPGLAAAERRVWRALESGARHVDELCALCDLGAAEALSALSNLEFRGLARQVSGSRFARG